jgi:hypothetical protein
MCPIHEVPLMISGTCSAEQLIYVFYVKGIISVHLFYKQVVLR